ncbi:MAG: nuclear transport factor 2 family protein [Novosphingobium sp.]|nr:nuclear transport factor 2 family protein [Novosphingobium sp.]
MTEAEKVAAIEEIRQLKAKYWRGVDMVDGDLVRSILAEDCVLDYHGCMTDPVTGVDFMPQMNMTMTGRDSWQTGNLEKARAVTVHQGHQHEIELTSDTSATGIWVFTDRFFMPEGAPFSRLTGYGHYFETYEKVGEKWLLKTTRITRLWVEAS